MSLLEMTGQVLQASLKVLKKGGSMSRNVQFSIKGPEKNLGDHFIVRRSLPSKNQRLVGPFIFWDHMGPVTLDQNTPLVVKAHPHIGLSTITYLFKGEITHRDSVGNEIVIKPGEVNWMTAGRGIVHSERSHPENSMDLEGIQLWVALPEEFEEVEESFTHYKESQLPKIKHENFELTLIAGGAFGQKSPLPVYSKLFYLNGTGSDGGHLNFPIEPQQQGAVYVIDGEINVSGETYDKFSMVVFNKGEDIQFETAGDCHFMLLGGDRFEKDPHIWWNFVSHDKAKIEKAKKRWTSGDFPKVQNETESTPLPDN
jgi:redox-sensitive bicupin YhaK (pirin superfamily)